MNTTKSANILDTCEKALRQTASDAIGAGDYDSARQVMAFAENVAAMLAIAQRLSRGVGTGGTANAAIGDAKGAAQRPLTPPPIPVEDQYPRFARRGDELLKIAWSKQERKEYTHRAPRAALDAVVRQLKQLAAAGTFTSDDLSLLKDPATGRVFPLYQIFVVLAWLRKLGLVKQHGRKTGYTLLTDRPLDDTINAAWEELSQWRG